MAFLIPISLIFAQDANGNPASGAKCYIYDTGTTNFKNTYPDNTLLTAANANPLVADSNGIFDPAFIADAATFKLVLKNSTGLATYYTRDGLSAPAAASSSNGTRTYQTKSADYTLVAGDSGNLIDVSASGAARTITANATTLGNGFWITIGKSDATGNAVTITPGGGETIDGAASYAIDTQYETVTLQSIGAAGWRVQARTSVEPVGELPAINAQTGTTYTLALTDKGQKVTLSNGSAITLTVPANATVAFPINARIELTQLGAGQVTIAAAGGVTLQSFSSWLKIVGQYAGVVLTKTAVNTWLVEGNVSA